MPRTPVDDFSYSLKGLASPISYQPPLDLRNFSKDVLLRQLKSMLLIRRVETKLAEGRRDGVIGGPVHLGVGQEAVAVGISTHLRKTDRVFGAHRSHSHLLALGSSIHGLFAEVLGKDTGHSKGMGGSMHLWDQSNGFYGSVPIVAGTVSLAVGAGLAAKLSGETDIAVAYFGDGAVEEGVVHESFNLARTLNIPIMFVVENNLFASHMHISQRQPTDATTRFAKANAIPHRTIDGNDIVAVSNAANELIEISRSGKGPTFLEAVTFRWYGHVDWREDIDVGVNRSQEELHLWKAKDPVARLDCALTEAGWLTELDRSKLKSEIDTCVEACWEKALNDPYPNPEALLDRVYA